MQPLLLPHFFVTVYTKGLYVLTLASKTKQATNRLIPISCYIAQDAKVNATTVAVTGILVTVYAKGLGFLANASNN
jgi:hypothetical protein